MPILQIDSLCKRFGGKTVLNGLNLSVPEHSIFGFIGKNGAGKSTFLNLISGSLQPDSGVIEQGETLRIGYYTQRGISFKPGQTVLECVQEIADVVKASDGHAVSATTYLNRFLFPHDTFTKRVDILSGGEKRRLYLLMVLMQNPNMLILDEPTNDLDIMTLNVLEEYLQEFGGSLIIVSHDRYFLDKCVDHLFVFEGEGRIKDFVGQYSEYREFMKEKEDEERAKQRVAAPAKPQQQRTHDTSKRKLSYKEQRELEQIEADLAAHGAERAELEAELSSGTLPYDRITEISKRIEELVSLIDEKEMRWLELSEI